VVPLAVFVAVLWEFTRLGAGGILAAAKKGKAEHLEVIEE
jgi:hypothetical protein